jgi:hypothetical protein
MDSRPSDDRRGMRPGPGSSSWAVGALPLMFGVLFPLLPHTARVVAVLEHPPPGNVFGTRFSFSAFASSCSFLIGAGSFTTDASIRPSDRGQRREILGPKLRRGQALGVEPVQVVYVCAGHCGRAKVGVSDWRLFRGEATPSSSLTAVARTVRHRDDQRAFQAVRRRGLPARTSDQLKPEGMAPSVTGRSHEEDAIHGRADGYIGASGSTWSMRWAARPSRVARRNSDRSRVLCTNGTRRSWPQASQ